MRTRKNEYLRNMENMETKKVPEILNNQSTVFLYNIANNLYIFIGVSFGYSIKFIKVFINISGIYLVWIFLHYIASHLYVRLCVPSTIFGFLLSPFMTATPHCQGLRWIVYNAANIINNMWVILGTWIMSNVLLVTGNTNTP